MNTAIEVSLAIAAVIAVTGCQPDDEADRDDSEAVARSTSQALVATGRVVGTLQTAMSAALEEGATAGDANVGREGRARIEAAISALVAVRDCVSLRWTLAAATVQFSDCRIPSTEQRLDGSLSVRVRPLDRSVELTLDDLTLGPDAFDGSMTFYVTGPIGALAFFVDANLTVANGPTSFVVEGLHLDVGIDGVALTGEGDVMSPTVDASATADQLHWILGDCLPSSGTVSFDDGRVRGDITFLPATPATGEVELRVGNLPPVTIDVFPTCG